MKRLAPLAAVLFVLGAAGCGGATNTTATPETVQGTLPTVAPAGKGDPAAGKKVFLKAGCGACHTLKDAGTNGNVGPNLDQTKPSYDKVVERVTNGKPPMPSFKGQLTPQEIQDVAAYVSSVAGK